MMHKRTTVVLVIAVFFAACSTTKHIPEGDALYTGAKIKLNAENITSQHKKVYAAIHPLILL